MNPNQDLSKIRHVQAQDPVAADVTSQPTRAIELRLKNLESTVSGIANGGSSGFILPNVPIRTESPGQVSLYSVVFYNPATGLYELASANITLNSEAFTANPSALAVGIVVAISGSLGDIQFGGIIPLGNDPGRASILNALVVEGESGFVAGTAYYLSDTVPGKVTAYPPTLKIQVCISSNNNLIVQPIYATPDAIENVYPMPMGMRPVGDIRPVPPDNNFASIVGFDALEQFDTVNNLWRTTASSVVSTFANFGYMLADANVVTQPAQPVYVRVQVDTSGNITCFSANTVAALVAAGPDIYNSLTGGASLTAVNSGNFGATRSYVVQDAQGSVLGTLSFSFTAYDVSLIRHTIFRFPDAFQGWKATNPSVQPTATATVSGGVITVIQVIEGSVGYTTPPAVVITDGSGSAATAVAVINEFGTVVSVTVTNGGTGYVAPTISFVTSLASGTVLSGGSGAVPGTVTLSSGVVTAAAVSSGGTGYSLAPDVTVVDPTSAGSGAIVAASVSNGVVSGFTVVNGGASYGTGTYLLVSPRSNAGYTNAAVSGSVSPLVAILNQSTTATLTPVMASATLRSVKILSGGYGYSAATIAVTSPGTNASIRLVVDAVGQIIRVDVLAYGSGFTSVPNLTSLLSGHGGNNGSLLAVLGSSIQSLTVSNAGAGAIVDPAIASIGVPVGSLVVNNAGAGYTTAPTVAVSAPDISGGTQATVTARFGGAIATIVMSAIGTGYHTSTTTIACTAPPGGGVAPVLLPLFDTSGATGTPATLVGIQIVDPGSGYLTVPSITITDTNGTPGTGAVAVVTLEGVPTSPLTGVIITNSGTGYHSGATAAVSAPGSGVTATVSLTVSSGLITGVTITNPGSGYVLPPTITITDGAGSPPGSGAVLTATVNGGPITGLDITNAGNGYVNPPVLTFTPSNANGGGADASAVLNGDNASIALTLNGAGGSRTNKLQLSKFEVDFPGMPRPKNAPFYYNIKADPNLKAIYPAVPIDKVSFMLNGVEQVPTVYDEGSQLVTDPDADIAVTRLSLLWTTCDTQGSPWDASYARVAFAMAAGGRDNVIPATGANLNACWRVWEQTFMFETQRNKALLHINKASRFAQTGRVQSLAVLAPLRLVDMVTGNQSNNNGTPMTGQLLLVNDNDEIALSGTGAQINLTNPGELQAIFINKTGRPVVITAIILTTVFQTNTGDLTPDASFAAKVTVGTQAGGYLDIIGNTPTDIASTCMFAVKQVKTLLPDADQPSPLIQPNQAVFMYVSQPAGAPIQTQTAVAYVKGMIL